MRPRMSPWKANLNPQQRQSEVLDRCESAVCKRIEVRISRPEDVAVNRWAKVSRENIEYGYADLSQAADDEKREYEECRRKAALRAPDEVWCFVARSRVAAELDRLTIFDAQGASLGYSNVSEAEAWRAAWGKLKLEEERNRTVYILAIVLGCIILLWLIMGVHNNVPGDPLRFP